MDVNLIHENGIWYTPEDNVQVVTYHHNLKLVKLLDYDDIYVSEDYYSRGYVYPVFIPMSNVYNIDKIRSWIDTNVTDIGDVIYTDHDIHVLFRNQELQIAFILWQDGYVD
jgi:hypothetical protein